MSKSYLILIAIGMFICLPVQAASIPADKVMWGAVGHNDATGFDGTYSYHKVDPTQQMRLLVSAGLTAYRNGCTDDNCDAFISEARKSGITLLKTIKSWPDEASDEDANYARAYQYAYNEARRYRGKFKYYEASNELDNWVGMNGNGNSRDQYKADRYVRARGFLNGAIAGIHAGDPDAKVMVDDAGWCHYGFLQMLWEDGVRWDITAVHWYANMGDIEHVKCGGANVAAIHAAFGKPIWITEFNSDNAAKADDPAAAGKWIVDFITQINRIAPKYNIQAGFIYELLDEPNQKGPEAHYGIANGDGQPKEVLYDVALSLKPGTGH